MVGGFAHPTQSFNKQGMQVAYIYSLITLGGNSSNFSVCGRRKECVLCEISIIVGFVWFVGVSVNSGLLVMAVGSILLPSTLAATHTQSCGDDRCHSSELALSRFESLFLLGAYTLFLVFQLFTHRHLYESGDDEKIKQSGENSEDDPEAMVLTHANYCGALWLPITTISISLLRALYPILIAHSTIN